MLAFLLPVKINVTQRRPMRSDLRVMEM